MQTMLDPEIRSMLLDDAKLRGLLSLLTASKRKTAKLDEIWSAFVRIYDYIPSGRERRVWLMTVLEELDASEEIALPVPHGKQWDRTSDVPLPKKVTFCVTDSTHTEGDWKSFAWHPELQWVLDRRHIAPLQVEFLKRVNQGLAAGWFATREALKYRSLQLAGDEKRLQKFAKTKLFGVGKLSLEMLGCDREMLPIVVERTSDHPTIVMFENAAPFVVARQVLLEYKAANTSVPIGGVAYGAGKQVVKSAAYLPTLDPEVKTVLYVGDLDAEGLQIAAELKRLSENVAIYPATTFHVAMLRSAAELNAPNGWPSKERQSRTPSRSVLSFLDSSVRSTCEHLLQCGSRIPEEVLSLRWMRRLVEDFSTGQ